MTIRNVRNLPKDLDKKISRDFNKLIKDVHAKLSTRKRSPVWTGFFASSWEASTSAIQPTEIAENFEPWKSIKYERSLDYFTRKKAGPPYSKQTPPKNPEIKKRFPVKRAFNYKKAVFIGNRAKYSVYALEGGKVQSFIQGSLGKMIKENMSDKGRLFVGGGVTEGFGSSEPSVKYTEFSK
tara:strand:- start:327 stop:869 length:543 start_codon:yes stop_codon:yes gene_type:complete